MTPPADSAFLDLIVDTARQRLRAPPCDVALPSNLESTVTDITSTLRKVFDGVREATSFLVVAPPGGGKALVLTRVLAALATPTLSRPTSPPAPQVAVVRLSGGHTGDDRAILREVTAQLGLAATAVSVDAADPDGIAAAADAAAMGAGGGGTGASSWSVLAAMDSHLRVLSAATTGVLFVLEEFDTFAAAAAGDGATSLLYTLLNVVGSGGVRAALLGTTAHVAPTDGLEKRVRSRFVHRQLVLKGGGVEDILGYFHRALTLPLSLARGAEGDGGATAGMATPATAPTMAQVLTAWNEDVKLFRDHAVTKSAIERYLRRASATGPLLAAACRTVGLVGISVSHLEPSIFAAEVRREWSGGDPIGPPDETAARDWSLATDGLTRLRVVSLPPAEAGLLVVARKLARDAAIAVAAAEGTPTDAAADGPGRPVSRSVILRTYHRLHEQGRGGRGGGVLMEEAERRGSPLSAEAMDAALQRLIDTEVLVEVAAEFFVGGGVGDEEMDELGEEGEDGRALALAVDPAVVDAELRRHEGVPTVIAKWGTSWLE
ncbi:hypothetical protein MMPV_009185 [Pyropia vietnamensis]